MNDTNSFRGRTRVPANRADRGGSTLLRRGYAVLRQLAADDRGGSTFSRLRTIEPGLTAASLSRLLKGMQAEQLLTKDEATGRYRLHPEFARFARQVAGAIPLHERLQPLVQALAAETGESAAWFEPDGERILLLAKAEIPERFHYIDVGQPIGPLLGHGAARVVLAFSSPSERQAAFRRHGPPPLPANRYLQTLEAIRNGQAVVSDLYADRRPGPLRVARPVFRGPGGRLAGVLLVSRWPGRLPTAAEQRLIAAVSASAQRATDLLVERSVPGNNLNPNP